MERGGKGRESSASGWKGVVKREERRYRRTRSRDEGEHEVQSGWKRW
jgi:hypothetical protein